ncbi:MAG: hypothetical protein NXY57DRAFT_1042081 [Lentinula lateritia]|nr:MAG: hypothetical protein NXY57DRAFT_1042081 [Lentinula lateritia]
MAMLSWYLLFILEPSLSKGGWQWQIAKLQLESPPLVKELLTLFKQRPPSALGVVGGILPPKVVSSLGWQGADPRQLASAKHLSWNGKEDWESFGLLAVVAYTNSGPWQQWTVSICWPERTKSSVGGNSRVNPEGPAVQQVWVYTDILGTKEGIEALTEFINESGAFTKSGTHRPAPTEPNYTPLGIWDELEITYRNLAGEAHKTQDHRCIKLATREHGFGPQVAGQVTWWLPKPSKSHKGHSAVTPEMGAWFSLVVFLLVMGRVCEARYFLHVVYISLQDDPHIIQNRRMELGDKPGLPH